MKRRDAEPRTQPMMLAAPARALRGERAASAGDATRADATHDARREAGLGLIVQEPALRPRIHLLEPRDMVVGSGPSCDIRLSGSYLSRRHCLLHARGGGVRIVDLGSRNGTELDGRRVERARATANALLHLADVSATLVTMETPPALDPLPERAAPACRFVGLVGADPDSLARFHLLNQLAASTTSVLLEGPTGVGKELAASAIHLRSPRRDGPFVVVNCAALPPTLAEAELFGHRRGAFTGATRDREGAFVRAHGGTLFLDEVGELPTESQPKLLRALESGEVQALGGDRRHHVDVRVVSATNRSLRREVEEGRFRPDLLYRLDGVVVEVPPLARRPADIAPLASALIRELDGAPRALSDSALRWLEERPWPGNARQLRHHLQAAITLSRRPVLRKAELLRARPVAHDGERAEADADGALRVPHLVDRCIVEALHSQGGSRGAAIRSLGIPRSTFYARLRRLRTAGHLPAGI